MAVCKGCNKTLKNNHSLKRHRISCNLAHELTANLFRKRLELQRHSKERHGRHSGQRVSLIADAAPIMSDTVSISISSDCPRFVNAVCKWTRTYNRSNSPPTTSGCRRQFPWQYQDFLPSLTTNIPHMPPNVVQPLSRPIPQPSIRSPSPIPEPPPADVIKTDRDEETNLAFTESICLIHAWILTKCKTLRAAVMLQVSQLLLEMAKRDGGQDLAAWCLIFQSRKLFSLRRFLMQQSSG